MALASLAAPDAALLRLLQVLDARGYDFVTPTPATHARVLARRPGASAGDLRDVFGWSLPFQRDLLPGDLLAMLDTAGVLLQDGERLRSQVRVSRLHGLLFLHSAFPTDAEDSVFLGPDSYRFADFITAELAGRSWVGRVADVGAGAGVGALAAASGRGRSQVLVSDVNAKALRLARVNAAHAGVPTEAVQAPDLHGLPDDLDLVLANPPYIVDDKDRTYRDGGDLLGAQVSLDWTRAALPKLAPGGRFLLYTGSAILTGGRDRLREELTSLAKAAGARFSYRELDPDVFGEELEKPAYAGAERIAAVGAVLSRPRGADRA